MGTTDDIAQKKITMKTFLLSLDKFISEAGEAFAMLLIFGGLTILNTLSILHLYAEISAFTVTMSALLGVAISMTTITIVRAQREKYPELKTHLKVLKIVYPIFDAVLVYDGFNISEINKTAMSVIFAALLGLSMYALGMLNLHKRKTDFYVEYPKSEVNSPKNDEKNQILPEKNQKNAENTKFLPENHQKQEEMPKSENAKCSLSDDSKKIYYGNFFENENNPEKTRLLEYARTMLGGEISRETMTQNYESQNKFILALIERTGTSYSKSTVQNLIVAEM